MRKKIRIKKHLIVEDSKFNSVIVSRLINKVMLRGEKRKAKEIVYSASEIIENKIPLSLTKVLEEALNNVKPTLELKSWKIGGANYRVPKKTSEWRAEYLALKWIVESARQKKSTKPMYQRLAEEIIDSYNKTGGAFQKKENTYKEAISNMAFARNLNI